jgi:lipid II:glycine glycyltransferase (peptidoglycan interpeptide bridge formation enzyme)
MYKLLSDTAEGQFGIRDYKYYRSFWKRFEAAGYGQMFFAYFEGQVVAGAYAIAYGKKSTYKDGASIRKRTAYGASHLLQWRVIEWAKSHGVMIHDFCGSPPSDEINNPNHQHYGIGLFKSSFNKTVTDYIGCYDYIISPKKYKIWIKFAEKVAHRVHYYKYHDSYF